MSKGYLCFDPITNTMYTSRHVFFNESKFPFPTLTSSSLSQVTPTSHSIWFSNLLYLHSLHQPSVLGPAPQSVTTATPFAQSYPHATPPNPPPTSSITPINPSLLPPPIPSSPPLLASNPTPPSSVSPLLPIVPVNLHPMQTRSKSGMSKPRLCYKATLDYNFTASQVQSSFFVS